jgi:hypothetical protein
MVIPFFVNIFYIIFAFIYSRTIYKIIKSRLVQLMIFFLIIILPFSDILIQKVIKNYYKTFKIEPIIYSLPKKDDDGKIESLDLTQSPTNYFLQFVDKKDTFFNKRIKGFLEIKIPQSESNNNFLRIKFDRKTIKSEIIKNPKARYMINIQSQEKLFGLFNEIRYQLIDRQNKKVLVETISATFPYQKDNFRNKYLFWHVEKYDFFNLSAINENDIHEEDIIVKLLNAGHL